LEDQDRLDLKTMYGEEYFRTDNPAYFNNFLTDADDLKTGKNPLLKILAQYTSLEGAHLLDVGCASGALLAAAQAAGCHATGLEISAYAAHKTKAHLALPVIAGSLTSVSLPPQSADIITLIDVIEHMPNPDDDLRAVHRTVRNHGLLMIMTPNYDAHKLWGAKWHGYNASFEHIHFFGRKSLTRLLARWGFEVLYCRTFGMVDLLNYYLPNPSRSARVVKVLSWLGRGLSNKILVPLGLEHRLLMVARQTGMRS
jgi:2-polyprenyl-3-methyl-5-hydroxy-6-metoxy-1,4-benzoquinol methylase